mgnify:CR=1 FL=1
MKFQQWDGAKWKVLTDWMEPDRKLVRAKVEEDAAQYAKRKGHHRARLLQGKIGNRTTSGRLRAAVFIP